MSVSINETFQAAASDPSTRARRTPASTDAVGSTLASLGSAGGGAVSATVAFSSRALHALAHAGEEAVDGIEDVAAGAWHAVEHAATEVAGVAEAAWTGLKAGVADLESAGEAVAGAVETGVSEAIATGKTVASQIGHYAQVGFQATGDAVSEVASGTVLAAAAGGKALMAIL